MNSASVRVGLPRTTPPADSRRVESFLAHNDIAIATFRRAEQLSDSSGMRLHSAIARWVQGLLMGGHTEKELTPPVDDILLAQGIARPDRIAAVIAPGKCFLRNEDLTRRHEEKTVVQISRVWSSKSTPSVAPPSLGPRHRATE